MYSAGDSSVDPIYEAISDSESDSAHQMSVNSAGPVILHRDSSSLAFSLTSKSSISNMSTGSTGRHSSTSGSGSGSESSSSITSSPPNAKKMSQSNRVLNSIRRSLSFNSRRSSKPRPPPVTATQTMAPKLGRGPNYEKEHDFKVTTYKGKRYCAYCGNYMWGLIEQGVQCGECGIDAHKNCSRHIPLDCCPDPKLIRRVFGVDLVTIVKLHGTHRPLVVGLCVSELKRRGALNTEGLYRENGDGTLIDKLILQFDHSKFRTLYH